MEVMEVFYLSRRDRAEVDITNLGSTNPFVGGYRLQPYA
jgi:hypothetical protein